MSPRIGTPRRAARPGDDLLSTKAGFNSVFLVVAGLVQPMILTYSSRIWPPMGLGIAPQRPSSIGGEKPHQAIRVLRRAVDAELVDIIPAWPFWRITASANSTFTDDAEKRCAGAMYAAPLASSATRTFGSTIVHEAARLFHFGERTAKCSPRDPERGECGDHPQLPLRPPPRRGANGGRP